MNLVSFAQFLPERHLRHFLRKFSDFLPNFHPLSLLKTIGNPVLRHRLGTGPAGPVQLFRPTGLHRFLPVFFNFFGHGSLLILLLFNDSMVSTVEKYDLESFPLTILQSYSTAHL